MLGVPSEHSKTFDPKNVGDKSYKERLRIASTIAYKSKCRLCGMRSLICVGLSVCAVAFSTSVGLMQYELLHCVGR